MSLLISNERYCATSYVHFRLIDLIKIMLTCHTDDVLFIVLINIVKMTTNKSFSCDLHEFALSIPAFKLTL